MTNALVRARLSGAVAVTPRPLPAYRDMFLLTDDDLQAGPILDCPAGASPFGALVRDLGGEVVGVDPAYLEPDSLVDRAAADIARVAEWQRGHPDVTLYGAWGPMDRGHVLRRIDGRWRLVHRHADFPPADQRRA